MGQGSKRASVRRRTGRGSAWARLACVAAWALAPLGAAAADAPEVVQTVCAACHGPDGNSLAPTFPKLAGLQVEYLEKQLREFLSGKRKNDLMDSSLPALKAANLGDVVAYYASQKRSAGTVSDDKLAAAGKAIYDDGNTGSGVPSCSGCHQPEGEGNARYPRLAGQHATYTMAQMQAFKEGTRTNDKARVMRAVAARMTEQEIAAVAEYIAGL